MSSQDNILTSSAPLHIIPSRKAWWRASDKAEYVWDFAMSGVWGDRKSFMLELHTSSLGELRTLLLLRTESTGSPFTSASLTQSLDVSNLVSSDSELGSSSRSVLGEGVRLLNTFLKARAKETPTSPFLLRVTGLSLLQSAGG
ncbi:hypothetical protein E2C01_020657 [Portunus trituberculatus]|uniref:Uncharacterized protein n=1 Tax=Portunus trituberculatus TaxID=210409 RepID=A0A5B7E2X5_PORTR|nr:hypothetical protein [Portunus trituberculatus]